MRALFGTYPGWMILCLALSALLPDRPTQAAERIALVVGNGAYADSPLRNPVNDATAVAAALERIGYRVIRRTDAGRSALLRALREFRDALRGAELGLFYYAGHGAQFQGRNYLIPVDAAIREAADLDIEGLEARRILRQMESAGEQVNVVILDACRDNPYPAATRSAARGLARVEQPVGGSLIAFATSPGMTAADGDGRHSPYTAALLEELAEPERGLTEFFIAVGYRVSQTTKKRQIPWLQVSPLPPIRLAGSLREDQPAETPDTPATLEIITQPAGAIVYLDGARLGPAPQTVTGPGEGRQRVRIEARRDGYRDATETVWLRAGQASTLRLVLTQEPDTTRLTVETEPAGARIRIMNIMPVYRDGMELEPGRYDIEVSAPGHRTYRRWHELAAGDQILEVALDERPAQATARTLRDRLRDGSQGPELVRIEPGCFQMGSPASEALRYDNERRHRVCIEAAYYLGKYEVTFAEYDRFARATGRDLPNDRGWGRGNRPVINVSWHDAVAYAEWLSAQTGERYRLPTEAEWEYAARAGTESAYWWGERASHEYANYGQDECCGGRAVGRDRWEYTAPVGQFPANPWGLHDTVGNVWEWTCSEYDTHYGGAETRCIGNNRSDALRVPRGGAWGSNPRGVRSALRTGATPGTRNVNLGFRLARSP